MVKIDDGTCAIAEGAERFDWRFELDADTWIGMTTGDFMGQEAFMLGRVTVEGNPVIGMAFDQAFTPPPS
jgi:putative sterol carrier protein